MMRLAPLTLGSARWPLLALAILFGAASVAYSVVWMYHVRVQPTAFLGIDYEYVGPASGVLITSVGRGTPADRAGLEAGDRIVGVNGKPSLKWLGIGLALAVAMPLANITFVARGFEPLTLVARRATSFAWLDASYSAMANLQANLRSQPDARRRAADQVIAVVGLVPKRSSRVSCGG